MSHHACSRCGCSCNRISVLQPFCYFKILVRGCFNDIIATIGHKDNRPSFKSNRFIKKIKSYMKNVAEDKITTYDENNGENIMIIMHLIVSLCNQDYEMVKSIFTDAMEQLEEDVSNNTITEQEYLNGTGTAKSGYDFVEFIQGYRYDNMTITDSDTIKIDLSKLPTSCRNK